jgi:RNA polymerase I-specific transcription initiation factor RRN3
MINSYQAALYIFAFRHEEMVSSRKHLSFLRSLQFNSIVTCQLNPLRVCLPPVVKNFAAIARNYQVQFFW